jgi:hypothetical protein
MPFLKPVMKIAMGLNHCAIVTSNYQLFTVGSNI